MLDKIQGTHTDTISQSASLDRIKEIELKDREYENKADFIIDESEISDAAYQKYERENDIKRFSEILLQTDEKEASSLVLQKAFDGTISIDDNESISDLLTNSDLLNDII